MITIVLLSVVLFLLYRSNGNKSYDLNTLLRQSSRYAIAAQQDESPMIALLHINYAAAYFYAAKDIARDAEIFHATGVDVIEYKRHLNTIQDMVSSRATGACPEMIGDIDFYLAKIAGDM